MDYQQGAVMDVVPCPKCKALNPTQANNCMACGSALRWQPKPKRTVLPWVLLFVLSAAVIAFAVTAFAFPGFLLAKQTTTSGLVSQDVSAGSTPVSSGQTKTVSAFGVDVAIPATWGDPTDFGPSGTTGKMWQAPNGRENLQIMQITAIVPQTDNEMQIFTSSFLEGAFAPPYKTERIQFHGYSAIRGEGVLKQTALAGDYHQVLNFLTAHGAFLNIASGATVSNWDSGGKQDVSRILDSVVINVIIK